ncbi:hypothetical protein GGR51DRAFT_573855 [Nemania sp. FL0031]|nr:hypothetical protein GGR51DRAFT_573855 [Nemania sp. FL0031]
MSSATKAQAEQMGLAQHSGRGPSTKDDVPSDQLHLAEEAFKKVLHALKQLGLYAQSPKFFIIYAHENNQIGLKAHKSLVQNYISWFKEILFDVDSDRSPHGFRPMHTVAHDGASLDIIKNQLCLLPRSWQTENVDYVLVFYSELLARYMEDERNCKVKNDQTYMDVIVSACRDCDHSANPPSWDKVQMAVKEAQQLYSPQMNDKFHHVLTELALLKFRNSILGPKHTIPILLFEHEEQPAWQLKFLGMEDTGIRVSPRPDNQHQTFFKILKMFETLEDQRDLIEAFENCYQTCVDVLKEKKPQLAEYQTQIEVEIHQVLKRLNRDKRLLTIGRPIDKRTIRDILSLYSQMNYASPKRLSGEQLPESLGDIRLSAMGGHTVSIHSLFDDTGNSKRIQPRRILIQGKPGVGKSTLCRRIMYEYSCHINLRVKFDLVVQVPVRKLGEFADLADLLFHEYFRAMTAGHALSNKLSELMLDHKKSGILIILDGLDEAQQWSSEKRSLLEKLMSRPIVIVTSRYNETKITPPFNLNIEALGLSMEDVKAYIGNDKIVSSDTAKHILGSIERNPFIKDMVEVPIHLDIICWSWDEIHRQQTLLADFRNVEELDILPTAALYQAVVYALWRKDIPDLEKVDHGEKVTTKVANNVYDPARLDRLVRPESRLLEEISINLMKSHDDSDQFEFGTGDITKAIRRLELSSTLPLSLDLNLNRLSLLHSDQRGGTRRFSFIHLTFQEFFAARWLMENERELEFHVQRYKYNRRFERVWRFVVGLCQTHKETDKLARFFDAIQRGSRDLLGHAHQRLIMNCLSEVIPSKETPRFGQLRIKLENKLAEWLVFECYTSWSKGSHLAKEINCPGRVLRIALQRYPGERTHLLESIKSGPKIPSEIKPLLISWIKPQTPETGLVLNTLADHHQVLSPDDVINVIEIFTSKDGDLQRGAASLLEQQPCLPLHTLSGMVAGLGGRLMSNELVCMCRGECRCKSEIEEKPLKKQLSIQILRGRPEFPPEILESLVGMLEKEKTIDIAVEVLSFKSALPELTLATLIGMLKSPKLKETEAAAKILIRQIAALSPDHLAALIAFLRNEEAAARILRSTLNVSTETVAALVAMLNHGEARDTAVGILKSECALLPETLAALVAMIKNPEAEEVTEVAVEILRARSTLPPNTQADLFNMLQDPSTKTAAFRVLESQSTIYPDTLANSVEMLQNRETREVAATILQQQSSLPPEISTTLVEMLQNDETREVAATILQQQLSLPPEISTTLVALLRDYDTREAAARVLQQQLECAKPSDEYKPPKSLDENFEGLNTPLPGLTIFKASVAMLKYSHTEGVAVEFLQSYVTLPWQILEAIALMLEDEDRDVRHRAAKALKGKLALPLYILTPLVGLFREEETQLAEVFKCQLALPQELELRCDATLLPAGAIEGKLKLPSDHIDALVESLQHIGCGSGCIITGMATGALERQPDVHERMLRSSAAMRGSEYQLIKDAGAKVLHCQSTLPKEIAKVIAKDLEAKDDVRFNAAQILQRTLPPLPIWAHDQSLKENEYPDSEFLFRWVVEGFIDGELTLPKGISDRHMECLYMNWLREAYENELCWYVDGGVYYIETPGKWRIVVRLSCEEKDFLSTIRKIQSKLREPLGFPSGVATPHKGRAHTSVWDLPAGIDLAKFTARTKGAKPGKTRPKWRGTGVND